MNVMKQYRVQVYSKYKDREGGFWDDWGYGCICDEIGLAEVEKWRGERMFPNHQFRIVSRLVSDWKPVEGAEQ